MLRIIPENTRFDSNVRALSEATIILHKTGSHVCADKHS